MKHKTGCIILTFCLFVSICYSVSVYDTEFRAEVWLEYPSSDIGICTGFCFGNPGDMYTAHTMISDEYYGMASGILNRITDDKQISVILSDLQYPRDLLWLNDNIFEEGLLIANQYNYDPYQSYPTELLKFLPDQTTSPFLRDFNPLYEFKGMALGQGPLYRGSVYISTYDRISSVVFCSYWPYEYIYLPYAYQARTTAIAFDTSGQYGNDMYVGIDKNYYEPSGLYQIIVEEQNPNPVPYSELIRNVAGIAFDNSVHQEFGGRMYVIERERSETQWSLSRIIDSETIELLAVFDTHSTDLSPPRMQFGPDGSLYVCESNSAASTTVISRIYKYKTPLQLAIEHLHAAIAGDRQMLQQIEVSLQDKQAALQQLDLCLTSSQNTKKSDSKALLRELKKAITDTDNAKANLLYNIDTLENLLIMLEANPE